VFYTLSKFLSFWPALWSSGQSSWLQIQRSVFDFQFYQIFCAVVGLERGTLSPVGTIKELLKIESSGPGTEKRGYGRKDSPRRKRETPLYPQRLALTSPASSGRSIIVVRSRTKATEFNYLFLFYFVFLERDSKRFHLWEIATCIKKFHFTNSLQGHHCP
jgi:hypothetical protein